MRRIILLLLLGALAARADVVRLKNGNTLEGKVVEENAKQVKFRTGDGESETTLTLSRDQIVEIEKGDASLDTYKKRAAELPDGDVPGHYALAEFCLEHRLLTQAIAELRRVLDLQNGHAQARAKLAPLLEQRAAPLLGYARKLQDQGEFEEAEKPLITILGQYPDWAKAAAAHHYLAVGFAARKQYDMALTRWRRAIALDDKYLDAYLGAANAAVQTGKWADAADFTEQAAKCEADPAKAKQLGERAATLRRLLELKQDANPDAPNPERLAAEGQVLLDLGQRERGIDRLQDAFDAGARDPKLVKALALHNEQQGRVRQALELYKYLVKLTPTDDDLVRRRARIEKLLLVSKALATRDKDRRERMLFDIARSGVTLDEIESALRESAERDPQKPGLTEGSFVVDEFLTTATYTAYVPKDYDPRRPWPLILAFHRDGERGKEHFYNWETVATSGRYLIMCPDSPKAGGGWRFAHIPLALSALRHAQKTYNVDTNRVTIAGTGSGGLLAWATAVRYPDRFAAMVVRNAPLDEISRLYLRSTVNLPTYVLVSEQAPPDVIGSVREAANALIQWNYEIQREEVPGYARNPALPELNPRVAAWLDGRARDPYPSRVRLVTFEFSSASAYWIRIEKFAASVFDPDRRLNIKAPFGQEYSSEQLRMIYLGEMANTLAQVSAAVLPGNRINVAAKHIEELTVFLDDKMVDLDKPVRIYVNGELAFSGKAERSIEQLFESARYHGDPRLCYSAAVRVKAK